MPSNAETIRLIKQKADCRILFRRFWAPFYRDKGNVSCPFHQDQNPSAKLSKEGLHCFAEGKSWDSVDLYGAARGLSTKDAIRELAAELGIEPSSNGPDSRKEIAHYDYVGAEGNLLFQVVRFEPKDFRQRRPDGKGGWIWNLKDTQRLIYRLPEVLAADLVFIPEGEKDCDNLTALGLTATTCPQGAGKWRSEYSSFLSGKSAIILPDNDDTGRKHAEDVAKKLQGYAQSVKIVELPGLPTKGDVSDWLRNGGSKDRLLQFAQEATEYTEKPETQAAACHSTSTFPLTDFGNAERFAAQHREKVRYCHSWGRWLVWSGEHWQVDEVGAIRQLAKETARSMYAEAAQTSDDDWRKRLARHARDCESAAKISSFLTLAQTEPGIAMRSGDFDKDPWLLTVINGTLDLRTGKLISHSRGHLITKLAPVNFSGTATCPLWLTFLDRVMGGSLELISYLQKLTGYTLTGDTREKNLPVLYGIGDNGKTIFTATIGQMLGDYAQETPVDSLMIKRGEAIPNDIARLKGARLVTASEGERGQRLAESLIKRLTGGDKISARFLHQEWFEFTPEFKIWLSTNHKPVIRGSDNAIWNRIHLIPFEVFIPKAEQIPRTVLLERLRGEWPGILKWAVEGCILWQKEGLDKPEEVERATDSYRCEMDILGGFIADCCILNPLAKCKIADLYGEYEKWCSENREEPVTKRTFSSILQERGLKQARVGARADRGWQGIGLRAGTDTQTDTDAISTIFYRNKNTKEKKVKSASVCVSASVNVTCSSCFHFTFGDPPNLPGRCNGVPWDENIPQFPQLPHRCVGFRLKTAGVSQ